MLGIYLSGTGNTKHCIPVCREEQIHHQRARRIRRRADEQVSNHKFIGSVLYIIIGRTSPPNKKTELWWAVLSRPDGYPSKPVFEFGGIFLCWSDTTTPLLIRSGGYLHTARQE